MRRVAAALLLFAGSLTVGPTALAEDDLHGYWNETWTCGTTIPFDTALARAVLDHGNLLGFNGSEKVPPFVLGSLDQVGGTYLFARQSGGWTVTPLLEAAGPEAAYVATTGEILIVGWQTTGEPGPHSTAYSAADGLLDFKCNEIPDRVGYPDYWELSDLNGEAQSFTVVGRIHRLNSDAEEWSSLQTTDGGVRWSEPKAMAKAPKPLEGSYAPIGPANEALLDELRSGL